MRYVTLLAVVQFLSCCTWSVFSEDKPVDSVYVLKCNNDLLKFLEGAEPDLHLTLIKASAQFYKGEYSAAIQTLEPIKNDAEFSRPARVMIAQCNFALGEKKAAYDELEKIIKDYKNDYLPYLALGEICLTQKDYVRAKQLLETVLRLNSACSEVYLYLAIIYGNEDNAAKVKECLGNYFKLSSRLSRPQCDRDTAGLLISYELLVKRKTNEGKK